MVYEEHEMVKLKEYYADHLEATDSKNKNLLTLLITVFAIIISFNEIKYTQLVLFWSYVVVVCVFVITIICGIALLYTKQELHRKSLETYLYMLSKKETEFRERALIKTMIPKYLVVANVVYEIGSYLSIILLAGFSILKAVLL